MASKTTHSAIDAALGFRFQERFALLQMILSDDDEASVRIEALDDVEFKANGGTILEQLKHTLSPNPAPLSIKSVNLWTTLKAWIDVFDEVELATTRFVLISVSPIAAGSQLAALHEDANCRDDLLAALISEAERVTEEIAEAKSQGQKVPHASRMKAVEAFLGLQPKERKQLLERVTLQPNAPNIRDIEPELVTTLKSFPPSQRKELAGRLVEWWDRQVILTFEGKRNRSLYKIEIQTQQCEISSAIHNDALQETFKTKHPPAVHEADEMLTRQCDLVKAPQSTVKLARVEEWRARKQRSEWSTQSPAKHSKIVEYDEQLVDEWQYRHDAACETSVKDDEASVQKKRAFSTTLDVRKCTR